MTSAASNDLSTTKTQQRIRIETEAITLILQLAAQGRHRWVTSAAIEDEVVRNPSADKRLPVLSLLEHADERLVVDAHATERARSFAAQGLMAMDALHLALAESGGCDILLTTDDDFLRRAARLQPPPEVKVENPSAWILEVIEP